MLRVIAGIYPSDEVMLEEKSLLSGVGTGFSRHLSGRENVFLYGSILTFEVSNGRINGLYH